MFVFLSSLCASVALLDERALKQAAISDGSIPWFVMFGSKTCPACVNARPEFEKAGDKAQGYAHFGYADVNHAPEMSNSLGIRGIPAFFMFTPKGPIEYQGYRTENSFISFVSDYLGEGLEEADETWADQKDNRVILFTRRFKPSAVFSGCSRVFQKKGITFGMARDSDTLEAFGKPPLPSIWFLKDGVKTQYKGKQNFFEISKAISSHFSVELDEKDL